MELVYADFHTQIVFAGVLGAQQVIVDEDGRVVLCASRQQAPYSFVSGEKVRKVVSSTAYVAVLCDLGIYVYENDRMKLRSILREDGMKMLNCFFDEQNFLYVLMSGRDSKTVRRYEPMLHGYVEDELLFDVSSADANPRDPTSFFMLCGILYVQQNAYQVMNLS